ncbi:PEP-CTERM sorting domain-containing protein [Colwelliaceae bacterium MEBiC 14330]
MKLFNTTFAGLFFVVSSILNITHAGLITLDQQSTSVNGGIISYTNLVAASTTISDATFTLDIAGDLDSSYENVAITVDGYSLGVVFDNNPNNDIFDFSGDNYVGNHSNYITMTGVATIAQTDWANIIADGLVTIAFDLSSAVNCCSDPHAFTSGNISYDVPEPSTLAIFALGLIGFGARRLKK